MAKTFKNIIVGIYKITSPSGKIYVGQSKHIEKRFYDYQIARCEQQRRLFNSLFKHGWKNHIFEIIEECDKEELDCRERYWQDFYDVKSREKGLNCKLTACGDLVEEKTIIKIRNLNPDHVGKGVLKGEKHPNWGRKYSEFERFKLSVSKDKISDVDKLVLLDSFVEGDLEKRYSARNKKQIQLKQEKEIHHKSKIILDTNTGVFYYSLRELCTLYGFNYHTLKNRLRGALKNKTPYIYV